MSLESLDFEVLFQLICNVFQDHCSPDWPQTRNLPASDS